MRNAVYVILLTVFSSTLSAELIPHFPYSIEDTRYKWRSENSHLKNKSFSCPAFIQPEITFDSGSIYKDTPCRCEIDPEKKALYDEEVAALRDFMKVLREVSDRYVATPVERAEIAQCAATHIQYWANTGAMTGQHASSVGYHKTAEILGAASLSYLKIRDAAGVHNILASYTVHNWLNNLSEQVLDFYETDAGPTTQQNNHRYWDGYAVGAASIVLQRPEFFDWAMKGLDIAIHQIAENGSLPLELKRGDKAYKYHLYAIRPILGLAEMAAKNRPYMPKPYYPYTKNDNAIVRLAVLMMNEAGNLTTNSIFPEKYEMRCHEATWLELYLKRNSKIQRTPTAPEMAEHLVTKREECNIFLENTLIGGDMTLFFGQRNLEKIINQ